MRQRNFSGSQEGQALHPGTSPTVTMRFRTLKTLELVLLIFVIWALCTFVLWRYRGPCPPPQPAEPCPFQSVGAPERNLPSEPHQPGEHSRDNIAPVYIVEEHHEVLKYWYHAADKGLIPKTGNVVLHIDGHSDGATPFDWNILPLFRYPSNSGEIGRMMQQNDVFIVAAAITGLINRYIWVWPPWDTSDGEHPDQIDYVRMDIGGGLGYKKVNGVFQKELCACVKTGTAKKIRKCYLNNATAESDDESGIPIDESECSIKSSGVVEVVSERRAILMMRSGNWITHKDNVILDIDEDFYGCEASVTPLYNVGLKEAEVRDISMWIQLLVCAKGTTDERRIDNFFNYLIHIILDYKQFCETGEITSDACDSNGVRNALWNQVPDLLQDLRSRIQGQFCKRNPEFILKMLLTKLATLSSAQLKALAEVGVCLSMSPKTLEFNEKDNMRVCDGYNRPNETMVVFHTPDLEEIDDRTESLGMILDSRKFAPKVVTICRSVRDGYTPKKFFHKIEFDILETLTSSFSQVSQNFIFHDADLLGGSAGWYHRH